MKILPLLAILAFSAAPMGCHGRTQAVPEYMQPKCAPPPPGATPRCDTGT